MNRKAFSLIELLIVLSMMGVMAGAMTPAFMKKIKTKTAMKSAEEIQLIQNSALKYYVNNKSFPANVQTLKDAGLLNSTWNGKNPWGNEYQLSSSGLSFTVSAAMPADVRPVAMAGLEHSLDTGSGVSSTVSAPGLMDTDTLVYRSDASDDSRTMLQELFAEKVESNTGTAYHADYAGGLGQAKDIYVRKASLWLSELRPTVTEETKTEVIVTRHHPNPTPPPPTRHNSYGRVSKRVSWQTRTYSHPWGGSGGQTFWYLDGRQVATGGWPGTGDHYYSMGAGCRGTRDSGRARGDGCVGSFPVAGNGWGGTFRIGGYRSYSGSFEHTVEVWGHYYD